MYLLSTDPPCCQGWDLFRPDIDMKRLQLTTPVKGNDILIFWKYIEIIVKVHCLKDKKSALHCTANLVQDIRLI